MDFAAMKPADLRGLIRKGELTGPTTGTVSYTHLISAWAARRTLFCGISPTC